LNNKQVEETAQTSAPVAVEASWHHTRTILRIVLIVLTVILGIRLLLWLFFALQGVWLLLVLAIFFAYLIAPLVEFIQRPIKIAGRERTIPRALAIGIVYLIIFGGIGIVLYLLLPHLSNQLADLRDQGPIYWNAIKLRLQGIDRLFDRMALPPEARNTVHEYQASVIASIATQIAAFATKVVTYIPWLVLIPILAFFLLRDADSFRRSALQMLPRGRWRWRGDELFQDINSTLAAYIRAQLLACVIVGIICTIGFLVLGVPYWLAFGLLAGLLEFIPLAGPLVVAAITVTLAGFHSSGSALSVLAFLGVLRVLEDYIIYPKLIGQGIHLHPLAVIVAILSGAELAGVAGIFLAIPVIAIATVSYRHWLEHRGSEGLVADFLKPAEPSEPADQPEQPSPAASTGRSSPRQTYPLMSTTPEEMARARPDLTTGELKMPRVE
jgi:predicted PurR-regulated permease PerM